MTFAVKCTVNLHLFQALLVLILKNEFKLLEYDFGSHQLAMLFVVFLHFLSILTDLSHTLVILRSEVL